MRFTQGLVKRLVKVIKFLSGKVLYIFDMQFFYDLFQKIKFFSICLYERLVFICKDLIYEIKKDPHEAGFVSS